MSEPPKDWPKILGIDGWEKWTEAEKQEQQRRVFGDLRPVAKKAPYIQPPPVVRRSEPTEPAEPQEPKEPS